MLTFENAINLLSPYIGANQDAKQRINLVCERYVHACDPVGSLERVTFTVTSDANGEGFITLDERYGEIRGAVEHPDEDTTWNGMALRLRNDWYEYTPGNLGMLKSTDPMRGIIPIPNTQTQNEADTDTGSVPRTYKVPVCPNVNEQSFYTLICKRAFLVMTDDDEILPVQNIGAIKYGLKALDKEDAEDYARSEQLWAMGEALLAKQNSNLIGPEAQGKVQVEDDFDLASIGAEEVWGYGYGPYGGFPWN